jgi:hypothetical protein
VLQRILVLPLLTPLVAVLLVSAINPRPSVSVRLLTWSSPALPMGAWLAAAAGLGAGLSGIGTALALQGASNGISPRRQVRRQGAQEPSEPWDQEEREPQRTAGRPPGRSAERASEQPDEASTWAGPSRGAAEPAPTVSVPFRVIRQPRSSARPAHEASGSSTQASPAQATAVVSDDWGASCDDDW